VDEGTIRKAVCAELARLLSEERRRQGVSMNALAAQSGLSQSFISMFESQPANPTIDTLLRISRALDIDAGELLTVALANVAVGPRGKAARRRSITPRP
jgi:transcriptional regulator with XRE-family HTH domain